MVCGEARRSPESQAAHKLIAARKSSAAEKRGNGTGSGTIGKRGTSPAERRSWPFFFAARGASGDVTGRVRATVRS